MEKVKKVSEQSFMLCLIISFAVLTFLVKNHPYFAIDLGVSRSVQSITLPQFNILMQVLTYIGNFYPTIFSLTAVTFLLLSFKRKIETLMIMLSTLGIITLSETIKSLVQRPRPDPNLIKQVEHFFRPDSFPSGHVLYFIGFYGFLLYLTYKNLHISLLRNFLLTLFTLMILLIGISRIYLGSHWFSDVLGSYLLGTVWLTFMIYLYKRIKT